MKIIASIFSTLIIGIRPLLGPACCKFEPSCTKYAIKCLNEQKLHKAVWAILKRLFSCNPFN